MRKLKYLLVLIQHAYFNYCEHLVLTTEAVYAVKLGWRRQYSDSVMDWTNQSSIPGREKDFPHFQEAWASSG
jgi:hypothetical protein